MGFSRQEYWSGLPCPPPGDLPNPGIKPRSPTLQEDSLQTEPPGKPRNTGEGSVQFTSVTQLCSTFCNPMNHSTPGLPVHHQLLEFTQTNVHRVSDAIQPSHPLLCIESVMPFSHLILCRPLLLLPPIPPSIRVFSNESALHEVAKVLEFQPQHQSFQ